MVMVRKAIESTYVGECTIVEYQKIRKENRSTTFEEGIVLEKQPCKLSFETITATNQSDNATIVKQIVKLFVAPEIDITAGSKIIINQNNKEFVYKNSGFPSIYETHQELILDLFDGWA